MKHFPPTPALAPFIRDFVVVEAAEAVTRLRLPEPGLVMGVRYQGAAALVPGNTPLPDASLAGMTDSARLMRTSAGGAVVLARFHPGGAAQFFAEPLHELLGETVPLDALSPAADVARLQSRVTDARQHADRLAAMAEFLSERMRPTDPDALVVAGIRAIMSSGGAVRIGDLARRLATSRDPFEKRFRRSVGIAPKQFASLVRVQRAIASHRPGVSLATLAAEVGYFDESHFSRELRAVTGQPPGRFFRSGGGSSMP